MKLEDLLEVICAEDSIRLIDYDTDETIIEDDTWYKTSLKEYYNHIVTDVYISEKEDYCQCVVIKEADDDTE